MDESQRNSGYRGQQEFDQQDPNINNVIDPKQSYSQMTSTFNHTYNLDGVRRKTQNTDFHTTNNEIIYLDKKKESQYVMEEDS